jgi:hypothetical protein
MWYVKALTWGVEHGYTDGTNPNNEITREQIVTILYRYSSMPNVNRNALNGFFDVEEVAEYAKDALAWTISGGIIKGDRGSIKPQATATRAEVAAILHRFAELMD